MRSGYTFPGPHHMHSLARGLAIGGMARETNPCIQARHVKTVTLYSGHAIARRRER